MQQLGPPDTHHLSAALGWMELGCHEDALAELGQVDPGLQQHPDVLEVRWTLHAAARDWIQAVSAAEELVNRSPKRASGWLHRAYALRRAPDGGIEKAMHALLPAVDMFPGEPIIPFNLSCYACQLHRLEEARAWLDRAFKVGNKSEMKRMALADEDLKPLWGEIPAL